MRTMAQTFIKFRMLGSFVEDMKQCSGPVGHQTLRSSNMVRATREYDHMYQDAISVLAVGKSSFAAGTADGKAFIKVGGVSFRRSERDSKGHGADEGFTGLVEAVVFEQSQESLIGYMTDVRAPRFQRCVH